MAPRDLTAKGGRCEYQYTNDFEVTAQIKQEFDEHGYILVRGMFDKEEVKILKEALDNDEGVRKHAYYVSDGERKSRLCLWKHPGNDVTGMIARCDKVAGTMSKLLGDEVYHYHTKLMMKDSGTGAWRWHQDYGYWYNNGCLFPDMGSLFMAVDPCRRENGCLQILPNSHKVGRIEHGRVGGQTGADLERVNQLSNVFDKIYVEQDPGDCLFFHANLLHCSAENTSDIRRWAFNVSFNTKHNDPVYEHHHPGYTPLKRVSNDAVRKCTVVTDLTGKEFLNPAEDKTVDIKAK